MLRDPCGGSSAFLSAFLSGFTAAGNVVFVFSPFNSYERHAGHIYTVDVQRPYAASAGLSGLRTHIGLIRSGRLQME